MLPDKHIIFGIIFSVLLYLLFPLTFLQVILIFIGSIFIDLDHYLRYTVITKNFNPFRSLDLSLKRTKKWRSLTYEQKQEYKTPQFIFHGIEFWIILILLSFLFPPLKWILIGIAFHMVLDIIDLIHHKEDIFLKLSQIYTYKKNKNKKDFYYIKPF